MTFPCGSILIAFLTIPWQRMKYTHSFLYHEFEWGLTLIRPIRRLRSLRNSSIRTDSDHCTLKACNTTDKLIWSLSEGSAHSYQHKPCFYLQNLFRAGSDCETKAWNVNLSARWHNDGILLIKHNKREIAADMPRKPHCPFDRIENRMCMRDGGWCNVNCYCTWTSFVSILLK